jgi:hypothetical protein
MATMIMAQMNMDASNTPSLNAADIQNQSKKSAIAILGSIA